MEPDRASGRGVVLVQDRRVAFFRLRGQQIITMPEILNRETRRRAEGHDDQEHGLMRRECWA